jgi:uncharacterized glyoxalase superfamily protein PhnB
MDLRRRRRRRRALPSARTEGAEIITEPFDTDYGSRDYAALDPEGNEWHFGTYRPAADTVAPPSTGAA